jgi:hypothetical protein
MLIFFTFFIFFLSAYDQVEVFLDYPKDIEKARESIYRVIEEKDPKIVLFAKDHRDYLAKAFNKGLARRYAKKSGKRVCYFISTKQDYQPLIEQLDESDPSTINCFETIHQDFSKDFKEAFGRQPNHWLDLVHLAKLQKSGVKVIAVDKRLNREEIFKLKRLVDEKASSDIKTSQRARREIAKFMTHRRNQYMSEKVQKEFKRQNCEMGFFSLGAAHVFPDQFTRWAGVPEVSDYFPKEFSTVKINTASCDEGLYCKNYADADSNILFYP